MQLGCAALFACKLEGRAESMEVKAKMQNRILRYSYVTFVPERGALLNRMKEAVDPGVLFML